VTVREKRSIAEKVMAADKDIDLLGE